MANPPLVLRPTADNIPDKAQELLPRPSQKTLAEMTGLSESDLSRCLNDDQAVLLQLLWQTVADLDQVLAWDGSLGGPS